MNDAASLASVEQEGDEVVVLDDHGAQTPSQRRPHITHHVVFLVLCSAAIGASFFLNVSPSSHIATPWLPVALPSVCQFRNVTGLDCPGCGLTRAFVSIAHGDLAAAWKYNGASLIVFAFVLVQIPYRAMQLWRIRRGLPELQLTRTTNVVLGVVVAAMFAQWIWKMTMVVLG